MEEVYIIFAGIMFAIALISLIMNEDADPVIFVIILLSTIMTIVFFTMAVSESQENKLTDYEVFYLQDKVVIYTEEETYTLKEVREYNLMADTSMVDVFVKGGEILIKEK